ncbi:CPBP family intramembrane metalloprotease [Brevibacterium sp. 5221]|uniref:CPBP family intramembrane metalloprotease n=1 Tax=Brevibacterium rongguiense TaxID=2695267 RepID=A0A6N9H676_9MICO|nr:type II CAAX endopeptidase family protein [Brevibacterium rongguiense]MYM19371.1 CPBP family intramembrane metalloprotease [Brevibacterium rongguiense]
MTSTQTSTPNPTPTSSPNSARPAFHRLGAAAPNARWWRPLLGLLVFGLSAAALSLPILMADDIWGVFRLDAPTDLRDPRQIAALGLLLAVFVPAGCAAVRWGWHRPMGTLFSTAGRLRWGWLGTCTALAVIATAVTAPLMLLDPATRQFHPHLSGSALAVLTVVILLVPLQAAGEEVLFRGLLPQAVGQWLRGPAWAILLPIPLFVAGHEYGWVGSVDVEAFALIVGVVAWHTGGLEGPIAVHAVNNVTVFALGALGVGDLNAQDASPWALVGSLSTPLLAAGLICRAHSKRCAPARAAAPPREAAPAPLTP